MPNLPPQIIASSSQENVWLVKSVGIGLAVLYFASRTTGERLIGSGHSRPTVSGSSFRWPILVLNTLKNTFLRNIADEVWGSGDSHLIPPRQESSDLLAYDTADTERLENVGRASRNSGMINSTYEISSGLRVVGDYLDKQRALAFSIWWSTEAVMVKYNSIADAPKETIFTAQNLQDLKVGMYLRRSSRHGVK